MEDVVSIYAAAITNGNMTEIAGTLNSLVKVMPPGANQPNEGIKKCTMMLSAVAAAVWNFRYIRTYTGSGNWSAILLEGVIDEVPVQFIDQVHVGEEGLIDHIDIFLRPAGIASILLAKVSAEIAKRAAEVA